ncbi:MAG: glycine zipper 2TM domain-containing protein [Kiritimatiellae bacterium]|nr:glycine zipper 2TM domain-containing protein [Kiritimatiellia bacterium]
MKRMVKGVVSVLLLTGFVGCATPNQMGVGQMQGAAGGALAGGILGAILGNNVGDGENQVLGAAIGAALGGVAGNQYGKSADYTSQRLTALENRMSTQEVVVHNGNGSINRVQLVKTQSGYIGPRGEEYASLPSESQLKPYYGLD